MSKRTFLLAPLFLAITQFAFAAELPWRQLEADTDHRYSTQFKHLQGAGKLTLKSDSNQSLSLTINGKTLPVQLTAHQEQQVDLSRYTQTGFNQLTITAKQGQLPKLSYQIDYPQLQAGVHQTGLSKEGIAALDQRIQQDIETGFPGAVLLVARHNQVVFERAYGEQKRYQNESKRLLPKNQREPMRVDTIFDMASNSKMYATNFALMRLVSEGKLDLHKPLQTYLPEYQGQGKDRVTPYHLLTHSAGYGPEVMFFDPKNPHGEHFYSQDRAKTRQLLLTKVPFEYETGTKNVYSDTDYMLLGLLVEAISGKRLDEYVKENFYAPLGLTHTLFNPLQQGFKPSDFAATEIEGNSRDGMRQFPNIRTHTLQGEVHDEKAFYTMGGVSGHAGLFSTAREVATLASVMLNRGGYGTEYFFNPSVIDQFTKPSENNMSFGLGWRRAGNGDLVASFGDYASPWAFGHTGWTGTNVIIDPYYDLVIVLLTNRKHSPVDPKADPAGNLFQGDAYGLGKYRPIINAVYQALAPENPQ